MVKILLLYALGVFALAGCARTTPAPPIAAPAGSFSLRLTVSPNPPRPLDLTTFTIDAKDGEGEPLRNAAVTVDLAMPSMEMPKNEIACAEVKPGEYSGRGRFPMSGDWRANVTARRGGLHGERVFPLTVK